ncbi:PREDICTED: malonyl-CoA decarboxylase, mitochondrial-like [Camelina sativa]|uniref:Malonyl-CoA decarboxylase, mitochondrial-like n=1 Tax=Camelina sativa TaxID=90675 RepID=A0ABM0TGA3_CAMSA|nr:PREDICTED: malonyl-CoA decarboxylase, mitochondrial-like [Camelina sativa]
MSVLSLLSMLEPTTPHISQHQKVDDDTERTLLGDDDNKEALSSVFYRIERNLRQSLRPTYEVLFERLNTNPGGLRFLSILRAELLSILTIENMSSLRTLDSFLKEKLGMWLSPACLELHQITWLSPASLELHQIMWLSPASLELHRSCSYGNCCSNNSGQTNLHDSTLY